MPGTPAQIAAAKAGTASALAAVDAMAAGSYVTQAQEALTSAQSAIGKIGVTTAPTTLTLAAVANQSATVGKQLTVTPSASGGTLPYKWATTTILPPGLSINSGTGVISGTPTAVGTTSVTITVADSGSPQQKQGESFSIVVAAVVPPPPPPVAPLAMGTVAPETFTIGTPIDPIQLTASGGSGTGYEWTVNGLCPGLSINASGQVVGIPTANPPSDTSDSNLCTFTVTDSAGNTSTGPGVIWTLVEPTPPPPPPPSGVVPNVPVGTVVPTTLVFDDEFTGNALNTKSWLPYWFGDGAYQNNTIMEESNVSVGPNGLALALTPYSGPTVSPTPAPTGGIVMTDPDAANKGPNPAYTGFQIAPTADKPVFFEVEGTLPAAANGQVANWPAFWMTGQQWPEDGEIDLIEGLNGVLAWHTHWGSGSTDLGGQGANYSGGPGEHTFGCLWTLAGLTFYFDGQPAGTHTFASAAEIASMANPKFIVLENSLPLTPGDDLLAPATATVRYVRVWQ